MPDAGGLLIIGNWSDFAIETPSRLLKICGPNDQKQLAQDAPPQNELIARLSAARLRLLERLDPDTRLDLYVLRP